MSEQRTNANTSIVEKKKGPQKTIGIVAVILAVVGAVLFFIVRGTPATDIMFVEDSIEIVTGDTHKMDYVVLPNNTTNKSVKWQSSNPSIAKVSESGEVIGISEGEAVIAVATSNGKNDECLVTVKPTAFDYLKKLGSSAEGYTVGNYLAPSGATISIGIAYLSAEDALYIMNTSDGKDPATIVIPSLLTGDYDGSLERTYGSTTVHTLYSINAATLTSNTDIVSYYCDSNSRWKNNTWDAPDSDAVYTAKVRTMLTKVYQEVLEPNGYTYADLGFDSYS